MIAANNLVLVPPGIANFQPGLHRIVFASPKEKAVALFWIGKSEDDGSIKPFSHCRKPQVHAWNTVSNYIEKGLFLPAPEVQVEEPTNRNREAAVARKRYKINREIYLVVDAFSSLIVGVHVALEGPNLNQARIALYRAISDKTPWLAWLGLSDLKHLLPQGCVPAFWLADRGELHSKGSYAVQTELRTNLSIAAAYRAEWKALVERVFGILNCTIHWLAGAVAERVRERGTRDYRLDAVLTLKEFTRWLVRRVALLNLTRNMSDHLSAAFITQGVIPNPIGFWNYGIINKHGSAVFLEHQAATYKTLLQKEALLTRHWVPPEELRISRCPRQALIRISS